MNYETSEGPEGIGNKKAQIEVVKPHIIPQPTPTCFDVWNVILANGAAYEIRGVHLGGVTETSYVELSPLSEKAFCAEILVVPNHILEAARQNGSLVFLNDLLAMATLKYGSSDGLFNTACFQSLIQETSESAVEALLSKCRHVVRLHDGSHWYILPYDLRRYMDEATEGEEEPTE